MGKFWKIFTKKSKKSKAKVEKQLEASFEDQDQDQEHLDMLYKVKMADLIPFIAKKIDEANDLLTSHKYEDAIVMYKRVAVRLDHLIMYRNLASDDKSALIRKNLEVIRNIAVLKEYVKELNEEKEEEKELLKKSTAQLLETDSEGSDCEDDQDNNGPLRDFSKVPESLLKGATEEKAEMLKKFIGFLDTPKDFNTFEDIIGQEDAKLSLQIEVVAKFCKKNPQELKEVEGVLLYGPPGTGKTYLARAAAQATKRNMNFMDVPVSELMGR